MLAAIPNFAELETAWAAEFPGTSLLLIVLRTALALADWHSRHLQAQFHQFHLELHLTGLPVSYWDPFTHRTFRFLQRHNAQAQREFRHALHALQTSYKKPETVKPPPPAPPPPEKVAFYQTVVITTENGIVKTTADPDAAFLCAFSPEKLDPVGYFTRQIEFPDLTVPDCYAHLLTDSGGVFPPKRLLFITYLKEHFLDLCRRELEINSPYLLDDPDKRRLYLWSEY